MLAEGVKHVYFQYVSVQGRVLAKVVPTGYWARAATEGLAWAYIASGGVQIALSGETFGPGSGATREGVLVPDLDTFTILPWDRHMARVFCRHFRSLEEDDRPGEPVQDDSRQQLMRALREFSAETGLEAKSGCEPEMSWFRDSESIDTTGRRYPPNVFSAFSMRHIEMMGDVLERVTEYASAMGLEMTQATYEDVGQLECTFNYGDFLTTADRLVSYRQICMHVAEELGLVATFMPKPLPGVLGNGCHHNVSFWRDNENILVDPSITTRQNLTQEGLHALGGLLTHVSGMTALLAPTVNSYKRNLDPNWSPSDPTWGYDNRMCAMRAVGGRIEVRSADSSTNPYLSHLAILAAVRHGLDEQIDPGPPQDGMVAESTNGQPRFEPLPTTMSEALDAFEADAVLTSALSQELTELFAGCKRDEWQRYCATVTDWDREMYLNYLP
jgi:glutamine synthetase